MKTGRETTIRKRYSDANERHPASFDNHKGYGATWFAGHRLAARVTSLILAVALILVLLPDYTPASLTVQATGTEEQSTEASTDETGAGSETSGTGDTNSSGETVGASAGQTTEEAADGNGAGSETSGTGDTNSSGETVGTSAGQTTEEAADGNGAGTGETAEDSTTETSGDSASGANGTGSENTESGNEASAVQTTIDAMTAFTQKAAELGWAQTMTTEETAAWVNALSQENVDALNALMETASDATDALTDEEYDQLENEQADLFEKLTLLAGALGAYEPMETGLPGARHESNASGDVFLGGNYIEVGVSKSGSFGTSAHPTGSGWHDSTSYAGLGLQVDGDGWDTGNDPTTGDFFLPGTPEERWVLTYTLSGKTYTYIGADRVSKTSTKWKVAPSTSDQSSGNTLKAVTTAVTNEDIKVVLTVSFGVDDKFYTTDVQVINQGSKDLGNVYFCRSFDPDQDAQLHDNFATYNKVICNPDSGVEGSTENCAMVVARGAYTLEGVFFVSFDNRATAACGYSFGNVTTANYFIGNSSYTDCSNRHAPTEDVIACSATNTNGYKNADAGMGIAVSMQTISAGASDSTSYYSSLDPDVLSSINKILELNTKIDYSGESISGLEAGTTYQFTIDDVTYQVVADEKGEIALEGKDKDAKEYSLIGKTVEIQQLDENSEVVGKTEVTIAGRPSTPEAPDIGESSSETAKTPDAAKRSDVIIDTDTITITKPVEGQEYSIDGGTTWVKPGADGNVVFDGLTDGTNYTIITRIAATDSAPASAASTGVTITSAERAAYNGAYKVSGAGTFDYESGTSHQITVTVENAETLNASVTYSDDKSKEYGSANPTYTEPGTYTVYYRIIRDGFYPVYGQATIVINKLAHADISYTNLVKTGSSHACTLVLKDTDLESKAAVDTANILNNGTVKMTGVSYDASSKTLSYTAPNRSSYGYSGKITLPVTGATYYEDYNIILTITYISKTPVEIIGLSGANSTYDGTAHAGYATEEGKTVSFTEGYSGSVDSLVKTYYRKNASGAYIQTTASNSGASASGGAPVYVGDYRVTLAIPDSDADYAGSVTLDFTISPKEVTITDAAVKG